MIGLDKIAIHNLFGIEGLDIAWYGILIALGIVLGIALAIRQAKQKGYTAELVIDCMILAIPLAIVCARVYYVAFEWEYYSQHPEQIIAIWEGGIAIYGAVLGGILAAFIVAKWRKFPFFRLMDFLVPGLTLGQIIGRWGNFFNQEAYGMQVSDPALQFFPFAVHVDNGNWYLATFFYESMWNLALLFVLLRVAKKAKRDGSVFATYLIGYGIGRFWIEGVRIRTLSFESGIPVSMLLSLILAAIGVIYLLIVRKRNQENPLYEGRYCIGFEDRTAVKPEKNRAASEPVKQETADALQSAQETTEEETAEAEQPKEE